MYSLLHSRAYQAWAPFIGRVLLGALFLAGASLKIPGTPGFAMEVGMSTAAGMPYATIFVTLAFLLELSCGLALILGWHARLAAALLAVFTLALALVFYTNFSDQQVLGEFISHLGLIAGLLYISTYGAQSIAVAKDSPALR